MKSWVLKNGYKIFQVLSGRSNVYLYCNSKQTFLIDTGKTNRFQQLIKNIKSLGIQKIDWLILTHTHYDHCQNTAALKEHFNCKIALHKNAAGFVQKGYNPLPNGTSLFTKLIAVIGRQIGEKKFGFVKFNPDVILQNSFHFEEIEVIYTPGHSSDSICIIIENEIGIVGDSMFGVFTNSIYPPYANNVDQLIKSWSDIIKTNCHTFLPGHGNPIDINLLSKQYKKYATT